LRELGFGEYVASVVESGEEWKKVQAVCALACPFGFRGSLVDCALTVLQTREKKQSKMEQSGLSEEELLRQQQELFRSATDKFNSGPME
jgi:hypothetical protein